MSEWINTAKRVPATGALCWIIWADTVQSTAYRRIGLGFACADGYAWQAAHGEGDLIPGGEVSDWMPFPDPPSRFAHKSEHWRNPETGQVECECCCRGAFDYDVQRHELKQARARIAELDERQEDYQGRLWCALGQPSGIEFIEAVKQMRARINEAEKLLSEGYLGLAEYIYEPVAVLPPDGSMDSPWMKRVRDFLDRDLKPAESPTDNRRNM